MNAEKGELVGHRRELIAEKSRRATNGCSEIHVKARLAASSFTKHSLFCEGERGLALAMRGASSLPVVHATQFEEAATVEEELTKLDKTFRRQTANNTRRLNEILAKVPPDELSTWIMQTLFNRWAVQRDEPYDEHMALTGHDRAVESLICQAMELNNMGFGKDREGLAASNGKPRIFGNRILEMSVGSGTVFKLLCDNIPPADREGITFIGNDLSDEMKGIARKKLAQYMGSIEDRHPGLMGTLVDVRDTIGGLVGIHGHKHVKKGSGLSRLVFMGQDLRDLHMHHRIDTAILSQTLHLIADPRKLPREQAGETEPDEHRAVKIGVIRDAFDMLPYGGHFVLIEEWPHLLTQTAESPGESLVSALFRRTLRPLRERSSFTDIMKHVEGACFVAELTVRIDRLHSMYAMIYRKDDRQGIAARGHLPLESNEGDEGLCREAAMARRRAMLRIYKAFRAADAHFIKAYAQPGTETNGWVNFIPLGNDEKEGTVWCCANDIEDARRKLQKPGHADVVVLSQVLHKFNEDGRKKLIGEAIGALKLGGALMFMEEWPPASNDPHNFRNRDFRSMMTDFFEEAMFEGALRETILPGYDSGMYGYLYRKKEG